MAIRTIIAATVGAMLLAVGVTGHADAAGGLRITEVYYDSPGSDSGSNTSLNAEFVVLKNFSSKTKTLTGWTVRDRSAHVYRFGTFRLAAGSKVTLHTGTGTNTAHHRYWRSAAYIWNNTGDRATLKNKSGNIVDRCTWGDGSGVIAC